MPPPSPRPCRRSSAAPRTLGVAPPSRSTPRSSIGSDGKTPALLFAVLTSPDAATLTVNSALLGSRPVLGSFAGHGIEVGYDGSTVALWTCFEVAPPLRDGYPLSVSATAVNSDGSRMVFQRKGVPSHVVL